jgi:hypothetical protein
VGATSQDASLECWHLSFLRPDTLKGGIYQNHKTRTITLFGASPMPKASNNVF